MADAFVIDDVATWLAGAGLGLTISTNLFKDDLPPTPVLAVGLFESGGAPPMISFSGIEVDRPHVQILVRGATRAAARHLMEHVYQAVLGFRGGTIGGYLAANVLGTPAFAYGEEQTNYPVYSLNIEFEKRLSTVT